MTALLSIMMQKAVMKFMSKSMKNVVEVMNLVHGAIN